MNTFPFPSILVFQLGCFYSFANPSCAVFHLEFAVLLKARQRGISILFFADEKTVLGQQLLCLMEPEPLFWGSCIPKTRNKPTHHRCHVKICRWKDWQLLLKSNPCTPKAVSAPNVCWVTLWTGASPCHHGWRQEWVQENQRCCPSLLHTDNFISLIKFRNPALGAKKGRHG